MRIAISSEQNNGLDSQVSHHFGHCPYFVLVDLEGDEVKQVETIPNPYYGNHQPGMVPGFINQRNVNIMLSGGMGWRAIDFFQQYGIGVSTGADGTARDTLQRYLNGELNEAAPCRESQDHAGHHHHQH